MIIDGLLVILPIPHDPVEVGKGKQWGRITQTFGNPLPGDYMSFIDRYGSGEIGEWLTVFNPFSENENINLISQFFGCLAGLNVLKSQFPETCPYPLMFEPGGLLPWGISIDGDIFCWETIGMAGKWNIVIIGRDGSSEKFTIPMCKFIEQLISGEIAPMVLPADWRDSNVSFVPYAL